MSFIYLFIVLYKWASLKSFRIIAQYEMINKRSKLTFTLSHKVVSNEIYAR